MLPIGPQNAAASCALLRVQVMLRLFQNCNLNLRMLPRLQTSTKEHTSHHIMILVPNSPLRHAIKHGFSLSLAPGKSTASYLHLFIRSRWTTQGARSDSTDCSGMQFFAVAGSHSAAVLLSTLSYNLAAHNVVIKNDGDPVGR